MIAEKNLNEKSDAIANPNMFIVIQMINLSPNWETFETQEGSRPVSFHYSQYRAHALELRKHWEKDRQVCCHQRLNSLPLHGTA